MLTPFLPSSIEVPAGVLPRFVVPEAAREPDCSCGGKCVAALCLELVEIALSGLGASVERPYMLVLDRDRGAVSAVLLRMPEGWTAPGHGDGRVYGRGTFPAGGRRKK